MKVFVFDLDDTLFDSSGNPDWDRSHYPIEPFDAVKEILSEIEGHVVLVTRGEKERQTRKTEFLGINSLFDDIYICDTDEGKLEVFRNIVDAHKGKELIVIGNRIDCEIRYGNMLGLKTILLKHGKHSALEPKDDFEIPDLVIKKFGDIKTLLGS